MALMRRERGDWPDLFRRFFEPPSDADWLRVEEFQDGDTLVVRAELPGIDPDKDVEVTVTNGVLRISAHREAARCHERSCHTGTPTGSCLCPSARTSPPGGR